MQGRSLTFVRCFLGSRIAVNIAKLPELVLVHTAARDEPDAGTGKDRTSGGDI
jgi:hypothetical protein